MAYQTHKALTSLREQLKAPAVQIATHIGNEILRYRREEERLRAEEERRLLEAAEAQRRAEQAALDAERQRIIAERQAALDAIPEWEREDTEPIPEPVAVVLPPPGPVRLASSVPQVIGGPKLADKPWACVIDDPVAVLRWILEKPEERMGFVEFNMPKFNQKSRELGADLGRVIPGTRAVREVTLKRS